MAATDRMVSLAGRESMRPRSIVFKDPRTREEKKYFLWFSTLFGPALMAEITAQSASYDKNFSRLADAGVQVLCGDLPAVPRTGPAPAVGVARLWITAPSVAVAPTGIFIKRHLPHWRSTPAMPIAARTVTAPSVEGWTRSVSDEPGRLVCEGCLARLGVTDRERVNVAHARAKVDPIV
ncbi:hypothetical protein HK097_009605 [Rhizophlyctis rosea]|uniref:Uncharacterized protein n=1 Tax=Rhizophlyctis rosea TaxID=64517 RepID=A0AAD5SKP0_9FUNG|nr:hypothetical protein HK097_009605 [Rhizophlyctis rosea]